MTAVCQIHLYIKFEKSILQSQQKHDWGTIGANFPGQCQGAELFDTGYQMAVATTSKLS